MLAGSARRASRHYLHRVLERPPGWLDLYRQFLYFASVTHDRLYLLAGRFDHFQIHIKNQSDIDPYLETCNGMLLYGAHFGSFESVRYTARQRPDLNISILMYEKNSRMLTSIFRQISADFSDAIIPLGNLNTMLLARDRLQEGHLLGLLADRTVNNEVGTLYPFLGAPAAFPDAPFKLQRLFGCPAVFIAGIYEGANRYSIYFKDLVPDQVPISTTQLQSRYVEALESLCRLHPYNWFNFYEFWMPTCTRDN